VTRTAAHLRGVMGDIKVAARLFRLATACRRHLCLLLLLNLISVPLLLLLPLPLKIVVDNVVGLRDVPGFLAPILPSDISRTGLLVFACGLLILVTSLQRVEGLFNWVLTTYVGERLALDFRAQLFRHVQRLSISYHDQVGTTDSLYRIQYDATAVQYFVVWGVIPTVAALLRLIGMFYVALRIDVYLALVAVGVCPFLWFAMAAIRSRLKSGWADLKAHESAAISVLQEVLAALRVVRAFGTEDREHGRYLTHAARTVRGEVRLAFLGGSVELLVGVILAASTALVLFLGVRRVQDDTMTLGDVLLIVAYLGQLYAPLETISKKIAELQSSLTSAERAFSVLDRVPDIRESPHPVPLSRACGAVAFRDVWFSYGDGKMILKNISFDVAPGTRVAVVGATGAGKTTLISLLTRFYDPTQGVVLLDGVDLRDCRLADLRRQFAIVLQEPVLFSTSIRENIAYGRSDASLEEVVEAAKAAGAHRFVTSLPERYDTLVGERGMRLSGGERQRISIARAFLKNAPVLILDEPTSAVDARTEATIMDALRQLMRGRTAFIIAHRPSTLEGCDLWLHIEDGSLDRVERCQTVPAGRNGEPAMEGSE
jgi:ATP-binding cassette subfamily B protein